jgi:DNA-directed RNA polymerase subunit L
MIGRPQLFPQGKQVSVLLSAEDYRALGMVVEQARETHPDYTFGDVLRAYIRRGLKQDQPRLQTAPVNPREARRRKLNAIARTAKSLARELEHERA